MRKLLEKLDAAHWPILIEVSGKTYRASYTVGRDLVYVSWCGYSRAMPVGTSDPQLTARRLAYEIIANSALIQQSTKDRPTTS
jgi:hypothetical protein